MKRLHALELVAKHVEEGRLALPRIEDDDDDISIEYAVATLEAAGRLEGLTEETLRDSLIASLQDLTSGRVSPGKVDVSFTVAVHGGRGRREGEG